MEKDAKGEDRNVVKQVVEPDHKDHAALMANVPKVPTGSTGGGFSGAPAQAVPAFAAAQRPATAPATTGKPAWAQ